MSLINANLLRVDPPTVDGGGNVTFTPGAALSIPCTIDAVKNSQRYTLGGAIADATAVIYVKENVMPAGLVIDIGYQVIVQALRRAAKTYKVVYVSDRNKGSISHYEVFLQVQ